MGFWNRVKEKVVDTIHEDVDVVDKLTSAARASSNMNVRAAIWDIISKHAVDCAEKCRSNGTN